jgi:hypothetical protein
MGSSFFWAGLLPICGLAAWAILSAPLRALFEARDALRAQELFRRQRERLEARFLGALERHDADVARRWDDAEWLDDVVWARDRQSRRLLALVGVRLPMDLFDPDAAAHATALFEFRDGRWLAEGLHLVDLQPLEAVLRHRRLEPIVLPQRRG